MSLATTFPLRLKTAVPTQGADERLLPDLPGLGAMMLALLPVVRWALNAPSFLGMIVRRSLLSQRIWP